MDRPSCIEVLNRIRQRVTGDLDDILRLRNSRSVKRDHSYVTEGDLLVQEICMQEIGKVSAPNLVVVSEENRSRDHAPGDDQVTFVIDPIDGTENFTSGLPEWGISISCYSGLDHMVSMIGCPEFSTWYMSGDIPSVSHESRIHGLSRHAH